MILYGLIFIAFLALFGFTGFLLYTLFKHTQTATKSQFDHFQTIQQSLHSSLTDFRKELDQKLHQGFEKTSVTFTDVVKRLALIDSAQQKLNDLSTNLIDLQTLLNDKRSRGAWGEIQLENLIQNLLPKANVEFQATLSNNLRVDCLLKLPSPTGNIAIDAKFPFDSYKKYIELSSNDANLQKLKNQFKQDVKKHISDIRAKYIIPGETAEGALLFIPAEAIFAEIHSHYPELVSFAQQSNVWLASPSTLMAILTTASAVIKDNATKSQIDLVQAHIQKLKVEFERFGQRMDKLAKHVGQAHQDVELVHTSAKKITAKFEQIDKVELEKELA